MMVVLSIFAFSTAAMAERKDVTVNYENGSIAQDSDWVYVNAGNFLHVGLNYISSKDDWPYPISFWVTDSNGKRVTNGVANDPNDDKAYKIGVPEGNYKLTIVCASNGAPAGCYAKGWIND